MYMDGGLDAIRQFQYNYERHELSPVYEQVENALDDAQCNTVDDARELLKEEFDYDRSKEAVRQLLHRLGLRRRKTGTFPGKVADFEKWQTQQTAYIDKLYKLMQQAENDNIDLVFGDAVHFVYGKFSNYTWGKNVRYAPSGHGRYRVNVYGTYDVVTNQVYSMYNEGYIDADFIVEYFNWLRENIYLNHDRPLHIVMDNARYQHCRYVKECAEDWNIVLQFLPGY
jgi:hypothetical protein